MVFNDRKFFTPRFVLMIVLVVGMFGTVPARAQSIVYRVTPGGTTSGSCGADWLTPCDLQYALTTLASTGDELWVAAGTYKPTQGTDRSISFVLKNGVAIYGGFIGSESTRDQRDVVVNLSLLSGDIGISGDTSDNSYHVVVGSGTDTSAVLDGFTITGGHANGPLVPQWSGGGLYNDHGSPTLANLTFNANWADESGGGIFNYYSNPSVTNVTFTGNSATDFGGGMNNSNSNPTLTNVIFTGNVGTDFGGGMSNFKSNAILMDVTFSGNAADNWGGGMHNNTSTPSLTNVIFTGNSAPSGGGMYNHTAGNPILNAVTFSNNSATFGGGMYNFTSSQPDIRNTTFSYNSAGSGGAIYNYQGTPILNEVQFVRNAASASGGAIYSQQSPGWSLTNVSFIENSATRGRGGGVFNYANSPSLTNVTFSGNIALDGGAMYNHTGSSPTLINVTFAANDATYTGTALVNESNSNPTLTSVILWDDILPNIGEIYNSNSSPVIRYSIVQGSGGSAAWNPAYGIDGGNNLDAPPLLQPLDDNGGFTLTAALSLGSPAIDTGEPASCPSTDQRGVTRPQGSGCDIGAYEAVEHTISGNTIVGGVTLYYSEGTTLSEGSGNYSFKVPEQWTGTVRPYKPGYRFRPEVRYYTNVELDQANQNYEAERVFTISGNAGVGGAMLSYQDEGRLKTVFAAGNGDYSLQVPENWSGVVTPSMPNTTFTPVSRSYMGVVADRSGENYTAAITVVNSNDSGVGSLRYAIAATLPGGTIRFAPALAGQTIPLTSTLSVDKDLTIDGTGLNPRLTLSGSGAIRIMTIGSTNSGRTVTLQSLILKDGKTSGADCGGALLINNYSKVALNKMLFTANSAQEGGAICVRRYAKLTVLESEFTSNSAEFSGGAIYLQSPMDLTATKTRFANNSALSGGAIVMLEFGKGIFEENVFEGNIAGAAGGAIHVYNVPGVGLTFKGNLFLGNIAGVGGGAISTDRASSTFVLLENNTLYGNRASSGGAIRSDAGIEMRNNTFSHNQANDGGASVSLASAGGLNKLYNNIFANSTGGVECLPASSQFTVVGNNNLVEDGSGACGTLPGTISSDPMLGSLAENGGSTQTMALLAGSPAIDAGDNTNCPTTDQRGVTRLQGDTCDIGAFEYTLPPTATPTNTPTLTSTASSTPIASCNAVYHGPLTLNGGLTMSITNPTGIPLQVQDVSVIWNHDKGHSVGADKTLVLQQASLNDVSFWAGNAPGPSLTITPSNLSIPTGTSTILFNFHQSYDSPDGSEQILITLGTNGCQPYPIDSSSPAMTPTSTPPLTATPAYSYHPLYLSLTGSQTIGGVASSDEDILRFNGQSWSLFFDGSDVGVGSPDLSAFSFLDADSILMSFSANVTVNGITAAPQDVLRFDATSLGSTTSGTWSLYFDGSDVSFDDTTNEKIDSIKLLPDGRLLISTTGNPSVPGATAARDEDVLVFTPASLGNTTSGTWSMYFDGSDVGLSETSGEDIDALDVVSNTIYLSAQDVFSVNGVSGEDDDVFVCAVTSVGDTTACNYSSSLYFDGSTWGLTANDIDGFSLFASDAIPTAVPTNTPTRTSTSTATRTSTSTIGPSPTLTHTSAPSRTPTSGGTTTVTYIPVADARVSEASPSTNYGTATTLQADGGSGSAHTSFILFNAGGMTGPILSAKLRVFCTTNGTANGPAAYLSNNNWHEYSVGGVTWDTQPPLLSGPFDNKGVIATNSWVEYDVTALMTTNATYSFALVADSSDGVVFSSREGAAPPQLVVTFGSGPATSTATSMPTSPVPATNTPTATRTPTFAPPTSTLTGTQINVSSPTSSPTYTLTPGASPTTSTSPSTLTFIAVADSYVNAGSTTTNYGSSTTLRADASPDLHSYLRFNVQGLSGTVTKATLRVFANSSSSLGCTVNSVSNNTWTESTINYGNAPAVGGALGSSGSFGAIVWVNIDVTAYITGNGTYNFALTTPSSTAISFASREAGANAPQLILETAP